jgi:hypothetical protein
LGCGPRAGLLHGGDRVDDDGGGGDALVEEGVDEAGVGAVLQQAADEVGEQVLVAADGGVGAEGDPP